MLKNSGASENTGIPLASHPRAQAQGEVEAATASIRRQMQAYEDNGVAFTASAVETRRTAVQLRATAQRARAVDRAAQDHASLDGNNARHQMRDGAQFPLLVVFHDGEAYWLAEGFHRLAAAREAELETIACEVRPGSIRDAILHSAGANATHGLRRSNADKRRAVLLLLEDEEWRMWSDREVSRRCSVSDRLVNGIRADITANIRSEPEPRTYQDRHGNVTQMRTSAIGRRPAEAPEPETPVDPTPLADTPAPAEPTNVVSLGSRLTPLPTPEAEFGAAVRMILANAPAGAGRVH